MCPDLSMCKGPCCRFAHRGAELRTSVVGRSLTLKRPAAERAATPVVVTPTVEAPMKCAQVLRLQDLCPKEPQAPMAPMPVARPMAVLPVMWHQALSELARRRQHSREESPVVVVSEVASQDARHDHEQSHATDAGSQSESEVASAAPAPAIVEQQVVRNTFVDVPSSAEMSVAETSRSIVYCEPSCSLSLLPY